MEPQLGIKAEQLEESASILKTFLADEFVLYEKTRIAHWNVEGPGFMKSINFLKSNMRSSMKLWILWPSEFALWVIMPLYSREMD